MADRVLIEMSLEGSRGLGDGGGFPPRIRRDSPVRGGAKLRMNRARPPWENKEDEGGEGR